MTTPPRPAPDLMGLPDAAIAQAFREAAAMYRAAGGSYDTRMIESRARELAAALGEAGRCWWERRAYDDAWDTSCGNAHFFAHGGPADNDYKFCPYCAGSLRADTAMREGSDDAR